MGTPYYVLHKNRANPACDGKPPEESFLAHVIKYTVLRIQMVLNV